jgi:hypothetical protein
MEELASSYMELGRLDESIPLGEQALALNAKVLGPQNAQTLRSMVQSGGFLLRGRPPG